MYERVFLLQEIIKKRNLRHYLEIGVFKGSLYKEIIAPRKTAVDPNFSLFKEKNLLKFFYPRNKFYEMTSDEFFKRKPKRLIKYGIDIAFIDGLHTYKQSLKDILNVLKHLNDCGVIMVHDCNPAAELDAYPAGSAEEMRSLNLPGWSGLWNGDVWKTIVHIRSIQNDLNIIVLNIDSGIGIITKGNPENMLNFSVDEIKNLTYKDLEKNREKFLNLKTINSLDSLYSFLSENY